jgi:uncharacterized protein YkwD
MTLPRRSYLGVALALVVAVVAGALLSRSLLHSGAAPARATDAQVLVLLNQQRSVHALAPLRLDGRLGRAANARSADMLRRNYFAHDSPNQHWDARIRRYVRKSEIGEILAFGSGRYATPAGLIDAWMHSPEHRRVILTPELRRVGIGIRTGTFRGGAGMTVATADFSTP